MEREVGGRKGEGRREGGFAGPMSNCFLRAYLNLVQSMSARCMGVDRCVRCVNGRS